MAQVCCAMCFHGLELVQCEGFGYVCGTCWWNESHPGRFICCRTAYGQQRRCVKVCGDVILMTMRIPSDDGDAG